MPIRRRSLVIGVVVTVVLMGTAGVFGVRAQVKASERAAMCEHISAINEARDDSRPVSTGEGVTVVLGDSYAQGWGLDNPRDSWPTTFGEATGSTVYVDAVSGSGVAQSTYCTSDTLPAIASRAAQFHPTTVIIQTGLNDVSSSDESLNAALTRLLYDFPDERTVIVGPPLAPQRDAAQVKHVDSVLSSFARKHSIEFVSLLDLNFPYQPDGVHPTLEGHEEIGRFVASQVG